MKNYLCALAVAVTIVMSQGAFAATVDLVNNTSGSLNGALYYRASVAPAGSGVIDSFVRVNPGGGQDFSQGYNTDLRPLQYDENTSSTFTHALQLSVVPIVTIGGVDYREFILDINQTNSDPLLTLNRVVISLRNAGNLGGATVAAGSRLGASGAALFSEADVIAYDSGSGNKVQMDYGLESGSGRGDMFLYVPNSAFTGPNAFVYLYSEFGFLIGDKACQENANAAKLQTCYANANDGYEEWAVRGAGAEQVSEPAAMVLLGAGLVGVAIARGKLGRSTGKGRKR